MLQKTEDNKLLIGNGAPAFSLPGVDGRDYSLADFTDAAVLVVVFTCNHCPYAQAYEDRLIAIQANYAKRGVRLVAINSNDEHGYPEDSFGRMVERAKQKGFNFPYLRDAEQSVANAYGTQCTPEIFAFDRERLLRYHGRIDNNWREPEQVTRRDLRNAIEAMLNGGRIEQAENPAIGCSLKWAL